MQTFSIDWPPSVNRIFFNRKPGEKGRGRGKTQEYRDWRQTAGWEAKAFAKPLAQGNYRVVIEASRPDKIRRDVDNFIKPVVDMLAATGLTPDDCHMDEVTARWVPGLSKKRLKITIETL